MWVGKGLFGLHVHITGHHSGKLRQEHKNRKLEAENQVKTTKGPHHWLALRGLFLTLSDALEGHLPRGKIACTANWTLLLTTGNQENAPQAI